MILELWVGFAAFAIGLTRRADFPGEKSLGSTRKVLTSQIELIN